MCNSYFLPGFHENFDARVRRLRQKTLRLDTRNHQASTTRRKT